MHKTFFNYTLREVRQMQEFYWNINSKKLSPVFRDLKALLHLWKRNVEITMTKEVKERLKKSASSIGEYEAYGHIRFDENIEKNIPFMDIIYDLKTLKILFIETYDGKKKKMYKPLKNASRHLIIDQKSKKV